MSTLAKDDKANTPARGTDPRATPGVSDDLNAQLVRSTPDGLWVFDDAGRTVFANDRLATMLGYTPEQVTSLPVTAVLDAVDQARLTAHGEDLADGEGAIGTEGQNLECRLTRANGSKIWASVSCNPLLGADGVQHGWFYRLTESSERQALHEKVTSSEHRLAEAQTIAKVGSWEWDVAADVVTWSDELFRIFDVVPQEFEATYGGFLSFIHPDDTEMVQATIGSALAVEDEFSFDCRIIKRGGEEAWIRGRGRATRDASGTPVTMTGTSQDITASVRAAQELAAARDRAEEFSRTKSDFLARMSHDIRTPLSGMIGLADLLLTTELSGTQAGYANGVARAGRTLLDMLDVSKIEAGELELEAVDFSVRDIVGQVADLLSGPAQLNNVSLLTRTEADVPRLVRGDPGRLGQVITNLVSNAVKFTKDGTVTLTAATQTTSNGAHKALRIEVTDTGIGIPAAAQSTLFDSSTQADLSTTRNHGGGGLGLTISRCLVEAMGGEIGFLSQPGVGSTFWFTADFAEALGQGVTEPSPVREPSPATEPRVGNREDPSPATSLGVVLVAEDNPSNQMVVQGMLQSLGYDVEVVVDGQGAVNALATNPDGYVAVLMDCYMPIMDGYEATRAIRLREKKTGDHIPVIALTASAVLEERDKCMTAGMDDFMNKPVDVATLKNALACWTEPRAASTDRGPVAQVSDDVLDESRLTMLANLRPGRHSFLNRFVTTFLRDAPADLDTISRAVQTRNRAALIQVAHRLKGSSLNLGAIGVGRVCQQLETAAEHAELTHATALVSDLRDEMARARAALNDFGLCNDAREASGSGAPGSAA